MKYKIIFFLFISNICIFIILFTVGELVVRQFHLSKTWNSYIGGNKILDEAFIQRQGSMRYIRLPYSTFKGPYGEIYKINSEGFRDAEFITKKNSEYIRIAFLGDSVTEGYGVNVGYRFTEKIVPSLKEKCSKKVETMNFGISGYNTMNEYYVLIKKIYRYVPDYIVLQIGFNDLEKSPAVFKKEKAVVNNFSSEVDSFCFNIKNFFRKYSALYLFCAERYNTLKLHYDIPNDILNNVLSFQENDLERLAKLIDTMHVFSKGLNAKFLVTYIPLEAEVFIKDSSMGLKFNNQLKKAFEKRDIPFIDVASFLRQSKLKNFFLDDCHLSQNGHTIVGSIIADHIH